MKFSPVLKVMVSLAVVLFTASALVAQEPAPRDSVAPDTAHAYGLEAVVVTAERSPAPLVTTTSAVSVVTRAEILRSPARSVADVLQRVPGLTFLNFDGLGFDPQLTVRGFYGGGEAEYVVVLVDGRPINGPESGLVNWDLIPLATVERIEVVRGAASSLYGDAAVGGVINLITNRGAADSDRWTASAGGAGLLQAAGEVNTRWSGRAASVWGGVRRSDGVREHAERTTGSVGGSLALLESPRGALRLTTLHNWRAFDEPGPLAAAELAESRVAISPFYRFDRTEQRLHRVALDGERTQGDIRISGYLAGEYRRSDEVRTVPLAPEFADSKERDLATTRLLGFAQAETDRLPLPWEHALMVAAEGSLGTLRSEYFALRSGGPDVFSGTAPAERALDARGDGERAAAAGLFRLELRPDPVVRLSLGGRLDWLRDRFDPRSPSEGERLSPTHLAFSPKVGVNVRYLDSPRQQGRLFASAARSFKAPTPDQLFDQRTLPVPFPPYRISFANELLEPQRGTSFEVGADHQTTLLPERLGAAVSLAAYQIDMQDEIDFDLQTFRYVNIGRSRHRGLETGLRLEGPAALRGDVNYTLQAVTAESGEFAGSQLKAVPRHSLSGGVSTCYRTGLGVGLLVNRAWGIYLDDANTLELPGYTRVDAKLWYPVRGVRVTAEVFNVLGREYSTTGFPDPAGTGAVYYYPAAGRLLQIGLSTGGE